MKKLNKFFAVLVALAMMAVMCVTAAFALDAADKDTQVADEFVLTKNLEIPVGTTVPSATFKFTATATAESAANSPTITIPDVTFTSTSATTAKEAGSDVLVATQTRENIFASLTTPGKYVYEIKETPNTNTENSEKYTYEQKSYVVRIYVDAEGKQTFTITEKANATAEEKKDGVEVVKDENGDTKKVADAEFDNTYVKTKTVDPNGNKEDPSNDAAGLAIEKEVTKDEGKLYDNTPFTFNVKATRPTLSAVEQYTYDVVNVNTGDKVKENQKISATATTTTPIELKTGERIVFKDLDVGAVVTVNETAHPDFTTTATLNKTAEYTQDSNIAITQTGTEYVKVENEYNKGNTGPEGILISNLPYIALALVAVGGLVAYVVVRRKNENEA